MGRIFGGGERNHFTDAVFIYWRPRLSLQLVTIMPPSAGVCESVRPSVFCTGRFLPRSRSQGFAGVCPSWQVYTPDKSAVSSSQGHFERQTTIHTHRHTHTYLWTISSSQSPLHACFWSPRQPSRYLFMTFNSKVPYNEKICTVSVFLQQSVSNRQCAPVKGEKKSLLSVLLFPLFRDRF